MPTPAQIRYRGLVETLGRATVNALFPKDFEYYMIAFELTDSKDRVVDYFVLPVMPKSLNQSQQSLTSIRKTAGGIVTIETNTFVPVNISLSGTFGRQLRALIGNTAANFTALAFSTKSGVFNETFTSKLVEKVNVFDPQVKTGYGATKILESMLSKSRTFDEFGNPYKLYMYNPAFGDSWLVRVNSQRYHQDEATNMLWHYDIELTAIARAAQAGSKKRLAPLGFSVVQEAIGNTVQVIKGLL